MQRDLVISSSLRNIDKVRDFVRQIFRDANLNMCSFNRIFLGISEAVNNAIMHGNRLDPAKRVYIKMKLKGDKFHIEVEDEGKGFDNVQLFDPTREENIRKEHGRGLFIISKIADEWAFKEEGRKIIIQFTIPE